MSPSPTLCRVWCILQLPLKGSIHLFILYSTSLAHSATFNRDRAKQHLFSSLSCTSPAVLQTNWIFHYCGRLQAFASFSCNFNVCLLIFLMRLKASDKRWKLLLSVLRRNYLNLNKVWERLRNAGAGVCSKAVQMKEVMELSMEGCSHEAAPMKKHFFKS